MGGRPGAGVGGGGRGAAGRPDSGFNPFVAWVLGVSRGGLGGPQETTTSMSRCEWGCPREPESVKERVCVGGHVSVIMVGSVSARGPAVPVARELVGGGGPCGMSVCESM